jgi:hypothetical protein
MSRAVARSTDLEDGSTSRSIPTRARECVRFASSSDTNDDCARVAGQSTRHSCAPIDYVVMQPPCGSAQPDYDYDYDYDP